MGGNDQADQEQAGRIERFTPEPVASPADLQWGRHLTAVCGVLVVALLCGGGWQWQADKQEKARARFEQERQRAAGTMRARWNTPPTLRKGPKVGNMSSWLVENAGILSYNGIYSQVAGETYNGEPVYRLGGVADGKALFSDSVRWELDTTVNPQPNSLTVYYSDSATLPGNWSVGGQGTPNAPTLSEASTADPLEPSFGDAPFLPDVPIRPGRVVLGGVEYVIFAADQGGGNAPEHGFVLQNQATKQWSMLELGQQLFERAKTDEFGTAGVFDALDGLHIFVTGGAYAVGEAAAADWIKVSVTPGVSATLVARWTVQLETVNISNFIPRPDGTFWVLSLE